MKFCTLKYFNTDVLWDAGDQIVLFCFGQANFHHFGYWEAKI